jgi:hypothetical protein
MRRELTFFDVDFQTRSLRCAHFYINLIGFFIRSHFRFIINAYEIFNYIITIKNYNEKYKILNLK